MYTILLNSTSEGHSYESFSNKFIEICNNHKQTNRALAFAFILYDFENPQIAEVLQNRNYWLSLNEISGEYLTVFSFHFKERNLKPGFGSSRKKNPMDNVFMSMVPTYETPSKATNHLFQKYFGNEIEIKYPAVAFFQIDNDSVVDYTLIQLDQNTIPEAFLELKLYIKIATETLKKITTENRNNSQEIFDLIESNTKSERKLIKTKRGLKKITSITELLSSLLGLGN
jgi:hypothetical protein